MTSLDEYDYPILYGNKKNVKFEFKTHKILMVCPHGYTGLSYYVYSLCQSLAEIGYDIDLFTSDIWVLDNYTPNFKIRHTYIGISGSKAKIKKGINYVFSMIRTTKFLLLDKGKKVHVQIVELPIVDVFMFLILRVFGKIIIFTPHDVHHNKSYLFNERIMKLIYRLSNMILVHKNSNVEELIGQYKINTSKISVIPHGGYEYFVKPALTKSKARNNIGLAEDDFIFLFFGDIRPDKDLETLIKATPYIVESIPTGKLLIAGRPSHGLTKEWVRGLVNQMGINKSTVLFLDFVKDQDVSSFYMAADLVVLPYRRISESGVLRYAQTLGLPVICSDLPEFRESIIDGKTGILFSVGDPHDLSRKIISAWRSGNLSKLGNDGRIKFLNECSWSLIAEKTGEIYEQIMTNTTR